MADSESETTQRLTILLMLMMSTESEGMTETQSHYCLIMHEIELTS